MKRRSHTARNASLFRWLSGRAGPLGHLTHSVNGKAYKQPEMALKKRSAPERMRVSQNADARKFCGRTIFHCTLEKKQRIRDSEERDDRNTSPRRGFKRRQMREKFRVGPRAASTAGCA